MILPALLAALLAPASVSSPPAATSRTAPSAQESFDSLFGPDREQADSSADDRAGRDDLKLVKVRSGRFVLGETLALYPAGSEWCASPSALFDILGIAHERVGDQLVVTLFEPRRRRPLAISALAKSPEGECIALGDAAKLADATLDYDPTELEIVVDGDSPVPALARLEREESRERRKGHAEANAPTYARLANPWRWAGVPTVDVTINAGLAGGKLGGSTVIEGAGDFLKSTAVWRASITSDGAVGVSGKLVRIDPDGDLLGPLHARRVEIGDVAMPSQPLVGDSGRIRGLVVSTAPEWRADIFDRIVISGAMPSGWRAELSSETRLLAFVDAPDTAGEYRFEDVPLKVGNNRFVVDLFGPHGEHERRIVERQIGTEQFPENETNVVFGIGLPAASNGDDAPAGGGSAAMFATLRHGISTRASARVDMRQSLGGEDRSIGTSAYSSLFGGIAGVSIAHRDPGGVAANAVFARRFGNFGVNASLTDFGSKPSAWASSQERALRRRASIDIVGPVSIGGAKVATALGLERAIERSGEEHVLLKAQASLRLSPSLLIDNQVAMDWSERTEGLGTVAVDWTRKTFRLRGQMAYRLAPRTAISNLSLAADFPIHGWALRLGAGYEPGPGAVVASIGAARRVGMFDMAIDAGWSGGGPRIGTSLRLAFGQVPGRGITMLRPGASRTAMVAPILTDKVGHPVKGGRFLLANALRPEMTDHSGIAVLGGLTPGRPQNLELQLSSLEDDRARPAKPGNEVAARQGQVLAVPIALLPTGSIEVRLMRQSGDRQDPLVGVKVDARSGDGTVTSAETDFDGFALFDGVPLGDYRLTAEFNGISGQIDLSLTEKESDQRRTILI